MNYYGRFLLILLLGTALQAFSQFTGHRLYTVADGLVQSEVVNIHQDKKGFLWIGTKNGVSRFDGHTFRTITDSAHIIRSWTFYIADLDDSAVVMITHKGFVLYEYGRSHSRITSAPKPPGNYAGFWIAEKRLNLIMMTEGSVVSYRFDRTGFSKFEHPVIGRINKARHRILNSPLYHSPKDGNICFLDSSGQLCIAGSAQIKKFPVFPDEHFFTGFDSALYFCTPSGQKLQSVYKADSVGYIPKKPFETEPVRLYRISGTKTDFVRDFGYDYNLLIGVLFMHDPQTIFATDYGNRGVKLFKNNQVSVFKYDLDLTGDFLEDREGNFWLGSPQGLVRSMPLCFANYTEKQGLFPNGQFVAEDKKGRIVAGSYIKGFQVLVDGRFVHKPFPSVANISEWRIVYPGGSRNHQGDVIMSLTPKTALGWNGDDFFEIPGLPATVSLYYYDDFQNNTDYFGTLTGLFTIQKGKSGQLNPVTPGNKSNRIVSIVRDGKGRLLIGGFQGLTIFEEEVVRHLPDQEFPYSQGANAMLKDHRGNVWIGNSDGLFFFDKQRFRKVENPWFNDLILSFSQPDSHTLFIGGLRGIGFLDLDRFYREDTAIIRYFDRENGFIGLECQQNAAITDHRGNLWIGATNSVVRIDPRGLPVPGAAPLVYISGVSAIDGHMRHTPLISSETTKERLILTHDQHNIRFDFTGIWFSAPGHLRFRYRLEGHESAWSEAGEERSAVYTNLKPGKYCFMVEAINDLGVATAQPAIVEVTIRPAIWQTGWFKALMLILMISTAVLITWLTVRRIRNRQQRELETKKAIAELRFKTLRNQLAPHFIFNALNAIGSSVFQKERRETYDLLHKFSKLIRHSLTNADKSSTTLAEEMIFVGYYLEIEQIRFENRVNHQIVLALEVPQDFMVPRMIIQTFVENAVKHGLMHKEGPGMIRISLKMDLETLHVEIEDNGIGRAASIKFQGDSTGKGLEIIRETIRLFNSFNETKISFEVQDLVDPSGEAAGTRVIIQIPQSYSYSLNHETNHA